MSRKFVRCNIRKDRTELKEYIQANEDKKLVVALAYLDNYEEALESVEDVRRSLLIALIDRKIIREILQDLSYHFTC